MERVLFNRHRDCNPFFHLYEAFWMLNGERDVESLAFFVEGMREYSDNGKTFAGAYGHRWRYQFEMDQILDLIDLLHNAPGTRRAVLQMWDCVVDLETEERCKDIPCNLCAVFEIEDGELNMTVYNRSNDIIWGMLGANVVHFSILQEYIAWRLNVKVGVYHQVSSNAHVYLNEQWDEVKDTEDFYDYYVSGDVKVSPLNSLFHSLDSNETIKIVKDIYSLHKMREYASAKELLTSLDLLSDWKLDMQRWLNKRERAYNAKKGS